MRISWILVIFLGIALPLVAGYSGNLDKLQEKAEHKDEADRGPTYADIVGELVDQAELQFQAGKSSQAQEMVKQASQFAEKAVASVKIKGKHIKKTEIKLRHSQRHLEQLRRSAILQDQQVLDAAIQEIESLRDELLHRMFRKD